METSDEPADIIINLEEGLGQDPVPLEEEHERKSDEGDYGVIDLGDPSLLEDYVVIDMGDILDQEEEKNHRKLWEKSTIVTMIFLILLQLQDNIDNSMMFVSLPYMKKTFGFSAIQAESSNIVYVALLGLLPPMFGVICDCCNRKLIIGFGIFFHMLVSLGTSFLQSGSHPLETYVIFIIARVLTSAAHASYSTIPKIIIGNLFQGNMRIWMLAIHQITATVGIGLAHIIITEVTNATDGDWRWGLRISSGFSLIVLLIVNTYMKDPPMEDVGNTGSDYRTMESCFCSLIGLFKNCSLIFSILGITAVRFIKQAITLWMPQYFTRARSELDQCQSWLCQQDDNDIFGVLIIMSALLGVTAGAIICQRYQKIDSDFDPMVCALCLIGSCPILYMCFVFVDKSLVGSYILLFFAFVLLNVASVISECMTLYVVPPTKWCCSESLGQLSTHLLGTLPGTFIIDVAKEVICKASPTLTEFLCLKYSLMICGSIAALGGLCYLSTSFFIEDDRKKTETTS